MPLIQRTNEGMASIRIWLLPFEYAKLSPEDVGSSDFGWFTHPYKKGIEKIYAIVWPSSVAHPLSADFRWWRRASSHPNNEWRQGVECFLEYPQPLLILDSHMTNMKNVDLKDYTTRSVFYCFLVRVITSKLVRNCTGTELDYWRLSKLWKGTKYEDEPSATVLVTGW